VAAVYDWSWEAVDGALAFFLRAIELDPNALDPALRIANPAGTAGTH
jgi:hypothetical protein